MTSKIRLCACALCFVFASACAGTILDDTPPKTVPVDEPCEDGFDAVTANNEFVNYTDVSADYKAYGERAPRDQYITPAGQGGNLSAAVPPEVEGEVIEYEEEAPAAPQETAAAPAVEDEVMDYEDAVTASEEETAEKSSGPSEDPVEDWLAEEGRTLKDLLTEWSERAGWRMVWKTNRNYTLTAGAMFRGRFADVSSALIRAFGRAKPAPIGTFYKGNRVLVIETLEDENAYE